MNYANLTLIIGVLARGNVLFVNALFLSKYVNSTDLNASKSGLCFVLLSLEGRFALEVAGFVKIQSILYARNAFIFHRRGAFLILLFLRLFRLQRLTLLQRICAFKQFLPAKT